MDINNVIKSVKWIEALNELDNLINKLLYDNTEGYILKTSRAALDEAPKVIERFELSAQKICEKYPNLDTNTLMANKKKEFLAQINEHYGSQTFVWAKEKYQELINNCLFQASIKKDEKETLKKLFNRALCALDWISEIEQIKPDEKKKLILNLQNEFKKAINSSDNYLENPDKSDLKIYFKLRELMIEDEKTFLEQDVNQYQTKLSREDINYFTRCKNTLLSPKKTAFKDELMMINAAFEMLSVSQKNRDEEKYAFIKEVNNDLDIFEAHLKNDEEKAKIIKRRVKIFSSENNYFKKLFG